MILRSGAAIAALALALAGPAIAQKPAAAPPRDTPSQPPLAPEAERAALDAALARGRLLFGLDRAAWVATDDLLARMPDHSRQGSRGYIVEREGEGFVVTFFGGPRDAPVALYRADVRDHRVQSREVFARDARPPLTAGQLRLAAARESAARAVRGRSCNGRPFNTAIVPPETPDGPIDVYLLTPQLSEGEYPLGGHFRLTVQADGTAGDERAFTNSCLTMSGAAPRGSTPAGLMVSHLLDPVPTEIHVFAAMTSRLPVFVMIVRTGRLYEVTGAQIRLAR